METSVADSSGKQKKKKKGGEQIGRTQDFAKYKSHPLSVQ